MMHCHADVHVYARVMLQEMEHGTLGGMYTTVEGLLTAIYKALKEHHPFQVGDSTTLHHSSDAAVIEVSICTCHRYHVPCSSQIMSFRRINRSSIHFWSSCRCLLMVSDVCMHVCLYVCMCVCT